MNTTMGIHELYQNHFNAVYKFFYFKSFDKSVAEDLSSQTFLIMVEKMHDSELIISDSKKFLYGIMRNVWLRHLQEKYRRNEQLVEDIEDFELYVVQELNREVQSSDEERVKRYIEKLPSSQKRVMELRLLKRSSLPEICTYLGRDMNYVKTTQKRAIKNLQKLVAGLRLEESI